MRIAVTCLASLCALAGSVPAEAAPYVGSPWTVVLCTFSDSPNPPADRAHYFRRAFTTRGTEGVADYFFDVSMGRIRLDEVGAIAGWYRMPITDAAWTAIAHAGAGGDRIRAFHECYNAAQAQGANIPPYSLVAVLTSPGRDLTGWPGAAIINDDGSNSGWAHELGHALGLSHSFGAYRFPGTAVGATATEYNDPFDIMSWDVDVFTLPPGPFGEAGPRLNAFHLDTLGFLRQRNILTIGADGGLGGTFALTPLYAPGTEGVRVIRVPLDPVDPMHYLSIELRQADSWDSATATPLVLLHEVRRIAPGGPARSFLLRDATSRNHLTATTRGSITVSAIHLAGDGSTALVQIASPMATQCVAGAVKREGGPEDTACVPPSVRDRTAQENARSPNLTMCLRNCGLPPPAVPVYVCRPVAVERQAFPNDRRCVTSAEAAEARLDTERSPSLTNPARFVTGPNTCAPGYVWRMADDRDYVCVSPQVRLETQQENAVVSWRLDRPQSMATTGSQPWRLGSWASSLGCPFGLVRRNAVPGDSVCVTPQSRDRAAADNLTRRSRMLTPS